MPSMPVIGGFERRNYKAGEVLHMECSTEGGEPAPQISWRNVPVERRDWRASSERKVTRSEVEFRLRKQDHASVFECLVTALGMNESLIARMQVNISCMSLWTLELA